MSSAEDHREEPGWRDYLGDGPPVYDGKDELPLRERQHQGARRTWHQVLTWYMTTYSGDSVNTLAGNLGWFELRLTHHETSDLFRAAKGDPKNPIELLSGQSSDDDDAMVWKANEKWARLGRPRGASGRDMLAKVPNVARTTGGRILGAVTVVGTVAAAIGVAVKPNSPEAKFRWRWACGLV
jgi:hypothetical protein